MKALISPNESPIKYVSEWIETNPKTPIFSIYENSCRVAEICNTEFEVAPSLFWVDCANEVVADEFYFDTVTNKILPVVNVLKPLEKPA